MNHTLALFALFAIPAVLLDLLVINRRPHAPTVREATLNSLTWVALACVWGGILWWDMGSHAASLYFTAYLMEKSLSVDNLFVFSLIFTYFGIAPQYRHKVLYYGIVGAVALRLVLISAGVGLVSAFNWLTYPFGLLLLYAGYKMFTESDDDAEDVGDSLAVRLAKRLVPVWSGDHRGYFIAHLQYGNDAKPLNYFKKPHVTSIPMATLMLLALVAVELADVIFAVDSIPVVVAFTQNFTIAFTSNLMAILGLRSMFFLLDHLLSRLVYLPYALGFALAFIGFKMVLPAAGWLLSYCGCVADPSWAHIPTGLSIGLIIGALATATAASVWATRKGS